jgi:hypothetical protein
MRDERPEAQKLEVIEPFRRGAAGSKIPPYIGDPFHELLSRVGALAEVVLDRSRRRLAGFDGIVNALA